MSGIEQVVKTRQKSLHDEGWQLGAGQETHAEKLDDVRVAEGAHYSAFFHELRRNEGRVQEKVVDLFAAQMAPGTATSSTLP